MSLLNDDLRVQRTLDSIQNALVEIVRQKKLDSISVAEIAFRARVNRTTFYRHYHDKYEVLEQVFKKALGELDQSMGSVETAPSRFTLLDVPEPWIRFFESIEKKADLYRAMLNSVGGTWFQDRLRKHVERLLEKRNLQSLQGRSRYSRKGAMPQTVAIAFSTSLFVAATAWWLQYGRSYSSLEIATWLRRFFMQGYMGISGSAKA